MASAIRILVVDDDLATLEFLRSILALAHDGFDVLGVPSAEEALLALRRTPFQLLITDVRLPGINGLELVRVARANRPDLPVILITAYALSEMDQEVVALRVTNFFRKPLDAEDFLEAVSAAVRNLDPVAGQAAGLSEMANISPPDVVAERLDLLRTDTGARQVIMATTTGELLYVTGIQPDFDLNLVVASMAASVNTSFRLANELNQDMPLAIQYLSGDRSDVYFTNIDRGYFVGIFIDAQERRGRIGTVWLFTQRAIRDIRQLTNDMQMLADIPPDQSPEWILSGLASVDSVNSFFDAPELQIQDPVDLAKVPVDQQDEDGPALPSIGNETATIPTLEDAGTVPMADTQFEALLARMPDENSPHDQSDGLIDAFWDEVLGEDLDNDSPGISLDEARDQGLIGPEFTEQED